MTERWVWQFEVVYPEALTVRKKVGVRKHLHNYERCLANVQMVVYVFPHHRAAVKYIGNCQSHTMKIPSPL
jgi:hypothetical protein